MLNAKRALRSDRLMKALTGLTVTEFKSLLPTFRAALQKSKKQKQPQRQRALGGGRKHTLATVQAKFFFILLYLKCYPTFDLAGFFYGVDRSQAYRWVQELLPVLETSLGWQAVLPERKISSVEQFVQQFPELKDVFIDGTQRPIQRSSRAKAQRQPYSGKKKKHTLTNLLLAAEDRSVLWLSPTKPGARQDDYRFKQTHWAMPFLRTWRSGLI